MNAPRPIGENALHAYLDGALPDAERADVESWLDTNPEDREKVEGWKAQIDGMHTLYDGVLDERMPDGLSRSLAQDNRPAQWPGWRQAATAVVLLAVGFAAGWTLHGLDAGDAPPDAGFVRQAVGAHVVFTGENRHAVEVRADKEERHLVRWLSKRLGHPVQPPPLRQAGFELVGGRLVADRAGPAAQFMYQDANRGWRRGVLLDRPAAVLRGDRAHGAGRAARSRAHRLRGLVARESARPIGFVVDYLRRRGINPLPDC
jgi:anti-sigma factor RsiW